MSLGDERVGVRDTLHLEITPGETEEISDREADPPEPSTDEDEEKED